MGFLRDIFKLSGKDELKEKVQKGALLLDVRSLEEYYCGHTAGSVNIPLFLLPVEMEKFSKETPIVAVCESGARSEQAVNFLKSKGFEAYNGGGWKSFK
ncbi:MAG: rhodanese-like domain-containing protein [Proteiniphilum sp.]|nr:rhodanese-like domain-containing protein [Proteiniphilum sp.]